MLAEHAANMDVRSDVRDVRRYFEALGRLRISLPAPENLTAGKFLATSAPAPAHPPERVNGVDRKK